MSQELLPDFSVVLTFLRRGQGVSLARLGELAGVSPNQLNDYEAGRKPLRRERLEHLIAAMGLPRETVDATVALLEANRAAARAPGEGGEACAARRRRIEAVALEVGRMSADCARSVLTLLGTEGEALEARQQADFLWQRLARRTPAERRMLVEEGRKFRTWALCERAAAESIRAAPNHPREALDLADLARVIAELVPGTETWRKRLQGYAWAHISNARRANNDLLGAEAALIRAWKLWEEGAPEDRGFLNAAWLPGLEASLRRAQRRFPEALKRIDEALVLDRWGELRAQILLTKARILETLGDSEGSMMVLHEAAPLIDGDHEPRLAFGVRFNLLVALCRLDRAQEAELRLPEVRLLAERLGEELDLTRVVWLEAIVAAGLGRVAGAQAAFEQVRKHFANRELAYDYALVSLELALLFLKQGSTRSVRALAEEMLWIFQSQGVPLEALKALQVFCDAARQEVATVELTRNVFNFLHRARHDPNLNFNGVRGAEAG